MSFHLCAAHLAATGANTLAQMPAVTDTVLTTRNSDFIVTDPFNLVMAYGLGSVMTELRANWPTLNTYGYHQFWPFDLQGTTLPTVPDRPALIDYWSQPLVVPLDEQLDIQVSDNPATTEHDVLAMWLATPSHSLVLPSGVQRLTLKATYSITPGTIYTWTGAQTLTFETTFKGGWYAIVGMNVEDPGTLFARLIFPVGQAYQGRILRPGCIVQQAYGNRPDPRFMGRLGLYGYFNSFEQPYIEIFSTTTSAHTGDCRFDVIYMGPGQSAPTQ
jgi:hypothetical protein